MAIVNRDLDPSQQVLNYNYACSIGVTSGSQIGLTQIIAVVPQPSQLVGAGVAGYGLSGAMNLSLWINRFIAGAGFTAINVGASLVAQSFGVSGGQTFNVGAGVTWPLQTGDAIVLCGAGADTKINSICVTLALKALQDIKSQFGASV